MAVVFLLGFSSGLPNMLIGQTLQQWLYDKDFPIEMMTLVLALKFPFSVKFFWAPLLDRFTPPFLGRRRGWMLIFQIGLLIGFALLSRIDPVHEFPMMLAIGLWISIMSASQDIVVDAYNIEVLDPKQRAAGSASYILGYRLAMLVSGSLTLVMADHMKWNTVYMVMTVLVLVGVIAVFFAEEPQVADLGPRTILQSVYLPFVEVWKRYRMYLVVILLFCVTFKFGEQYAQAVSTPFYRDVGFTKTEIGILSKAIGFTAFAVGGGIGGTLVAKYGMRKCLVAFGILSMLVHVGYLVISIVGHNLPVYGITLFIENLSFAMGTTALAGVQWSFCSPGVAATQMALLTAFTGFAQSILGPWAGKLVAHIGYTPFFVTTMAMAIPGIILAYVVTSPVIEARGSASESSTTSRA